MIKRGAVLVGVLAGFCLAGCNTSANQEQAYAGPGWYLEKPRAWMVYGPRIFGGPYTYDACETKRMALDEPTAVRMLCIQEFAPIPKYGPY
jgi:hypothetical protein